MNVRPLEISDILLLEPKNFRDDRGYFFETWSQEKYRSFGINHDFVQDNVSRSDHGVLRGLHFQEPNAQGKLVTVLEGAVFDVAVDVRKGSPTFGKWVSIELDSENPRQLWIPPGFAHGFCVTSPFAIFHYKCTVYYSPQDERTVRWNDPDLGIRWPIEKPIVSAKDGAAPFLKELR